MVNGFIALLKELSHVECYKHCPSDGASGCPMKIFTHRWVRVLVQFRGSGLVGLSRSR